MYGLWILIFKVGKAQFLYLSVYPCQPWHLYLHYSLTISCLADKNHPNNKEETSRDERLHVCRQSGIYICQRLTYNGETIPLKMSEFHNVPYLLCSTCLRTLVSLVKSDTAWSAQQKLKKNLGRDWECGEGCTSLREAAVDKHLTSHLCTSGTTQTAGASKTSAYITTHRPHFSNYSPVF